MTIIEVTRTPTIRLPGTYQRFAHGWFYECVGPDGVKYSNTSIVTLRSLLKRRYGDKRKCTIVETWKSGA